MSNWTKLIAYIFNIKSIVTQVADIVKNAISDITKLSLLGKCIKYFYDSKKLLPIGVYVCKDVFTIVIG